MSEQPAMFPQLQSDHKTLQKSSLQMQGFMKWTIQNKVNVQSYFNN